MSRVITVSGVAGAGKDTIVDMAMPFLRALGIEWAPGITTRPPRLSDKPGAMNHVSHERFLTMVANGEVMEYTTVVGQLYGTSTDILNAGPNGAIKISTVDGVLAIRDWMICQRGMDPEWDLLSVYVTVPIEDAHERLRKRGWTDEQIAERDSFNLPGYGHEMMDEKHAGIWRLVIHNPDGGLEDAKDDLLHGIRTFLR